MIACFPITWDITTISATALEIHKHNKCIKYEGDSGDVPQKEFDLDALSFAMEESKTDINFYLLVKDSIGDYYVLESIYTVSYTTSSPGFDFNQDTRIIVSAPELDSYDQNQQVDITFTIQPTVRLAYSNCLKIETPTVPLVDYCLNVTTSNVLTDTESTWYCAKDGSNA